MHIIILDGTQMLDKATAYDYIQKTMAFPDYFGHNLDALNDCLSELNDSYILILTNSAALLEHLGEYGEKMIKVFQNNTSCGYTFLVK